MRRWALLLALALVGASAGAASAMFAASRSVGSNTISTDPDWAAPEASSSIVAKSAGGTAGFVKQGGTYFVYANVADPGNPASGTSSVTADVSAITAGQTAATMTAGSYTVEGAGYNYRSGSLTAEGTLAAGTYAYSISTTDADANARTQGGFTVVVDNTAPAGADVQTQDKAGGTAGLMEQGDTITLTYGEPVDPASILAGWTGASTNIVVRLSDGILLNNDGITVYDAADATQLPLGSLDLGRTDYTSGARTFGASGTASTMSLSGSTVTITLGTASGATTTAGGSGTVVWTPASAATDRAGNACSTATASESGAGDVEF